MLAEGHAEEKMADIVPVAKVVKDVETNRDHVRQWPGVFELDNLNFDWFKISYI